MKDDDLLDFTMDTLDILMINKIDDTTEQQWKHNIYVINNISLLNNEYKLKFIQRYSEGISYISNPTDEMIRLHNMLWKI